MPEVNGTHLRVLSETEELYRALSILIEPGQVVEVRALDASMQSHTRYTETLGGYFDNAPDLIKAVQTIREAMGIYVTLQPCHPDILHRAKSKLLRQKKDASTPDKYIIRYRWLLIDSDPERVSSISSTDAEHQQALAHSRFVAEELRKLGWPAPIQADSGNGAHLLYRIDLAARESAFVKRVLEGLAARFNQENMQIDRTVYNPARICKLYGTLACKGDNTAERPHRMSRLLQVPPVLDVVSWELLEAMATPVIPSLRMQQIFVTIGSSNGHRYIKICVGKAQTSDENVTIPPPSIVTAQSPFPGTSSRDSDDSDDRIRFLSRQTEQHICTTKWEKRKKDGHTVLATHFSAGYWWCDQCEPQRTFMEIGLQLNYPQINVPRGFIIKSGRGEWLRFAEEAGYILMHYAVTTARQHKELFDPG